MVILRKQGSYLKIENKKVKKLIECMAMLLILMVMPIRHVQAASQIKGFDISSKNGVVDWEAVAKNDMDFVMLRTGEGKAPDKDTQFDANYDGAKA